MKAFKYILFLLLIAFIGTAIFIAVQPNSFEITRSRTIKAPVSVIYNNVIDFNSRATWSTWDEKKITSLETTETTPNTSVKQVIQFDNFPTSEINWKLTPNTDGTTDVTWQISANKLPFSFKAYHAFKGDFKNAIGSDFERGLEKLDSTINASMKVYSITVSGIKNHSGGYYLYNTASCKIDELPSKINEIMSKVREFAMNNNITMAGKPFTNYFKWDLENNAVIFSCCIPTTEKVITTNSNILTGQLDPFKALKTTLKGDYKNLAETWKVANKYIAENKLEQIETGPTIETYIKDPANTLNPADWITEIYIAVK